MAAPFAVIYKFVSLTRLPFSDRILPRHHKEEILMEKFIPYEKLSKKEKRSRDLSRRNTWGQLNPVTRKPKTARHIAGAKPGNWKRDAHEPIPGWILLFVRRWWYYPSPSIFQMWGSPRNSRHTPTPISHSTANRNAAPLPFPAPTAASADCPRFGSPSPAQIRRPPAAAQKISQRDSEELEGVPGGEDRP